jgi:hypothetical protein
VALSKFRDGSRTSVASQFGQRDWILARSAEDYLMIAEAYIRLDKSDLALPFINELRKEPVLMQERIGVKMLMVVKHYLNNPNITVKEMAEVD